MNAARILVVDDDPDILETIRFSLEREGHTVHAAADGHSAAEALEREPYDLLLTDLMLPGLSGEELIARTLARNPQMVCILITAHGSIDSAIGIMRRGAYHYVQKPLDLDELGLVVARGLEQRRLLTENVAFRDAVLLHQLSVSLCASLDLSELLQGVLDAALRELRAAHAFLLLRTGEGELVVRGARGIAAQAPEGTVLAADACLGGGVLSTGRPLLAGPGPKGPGRPSPLLGEDRYLSSLIVPLKARGNIVGVLGLGSTDPARNFTPADEKTLAILAAHAAVGIENARLHEDVKRRYLQVIVGFSRALESKDPYLRGHSERVAAIGRMIAIEMGFPPAECEVIYYGGLLHDLGKIGVPDSVLHKPAQLTPEEFELIRRHPDIGREILEPIPDLGPVAAIIHAYHEKYDGSGYPRRLKGDAIPVHARIVAVADAFDAMTSGRSYQATLTHAQARARLAKLAGSMFDPIVVEAFLKLPELPRAFPAGDDAP
jgi:response regulator RpfG family c-di-GMP phosphodiesterase